MKFKVLLILISVFALTLSAYSNEQDPELTHKSSPTENSPAIPKGPVPVQIVTNENENSAAEVLAKIDTRIANTLQLVVLCVTVLTASIALFGYFNLKRVEEFRKEFDLKSDELKKSLKSNLDQKYDDLKYKEQNFEESIRKQIGSEIGEKFKGYEKKLEENISNRTIDTIHNHVKAELQFRSNNNRLIADIVYAYIVNEIEAKSPEGTPVMPKDLARLDILQRSLHNIMSNSPARQHSALLRVLDLTKGLGGNCSALLLELFYKLNEDGAFRSFESADLLQDIVSVLENTTGLDFKTDFEPVNYT